MAVTTFTRTSFQKVWAMSMAISMTAMLVSPIGRPDGPIPRRNGAAPVRNEDVSSITAMQLLAAFGQLQSANGVVQTSRRPVLARHSHLRNVMPNVSLKGNPPSASTASSGLARTCLVIRTTAANWPTARCRWSVMFAVLAPSRTRGAKCTPAAETLSTATLH